MSLSEFSLIRAYFVGCGAGRDDVSLGVGDDCALLRVPPGQDLAVTLDSLVAGVHFLPDTDPEALGQKALAVNLSDLAAMGATPAWATLGLTLPQADPDWLERFSRGLCALATRYGVALVGGDTSRGPLSVTLALHGFVPHGSGLRRSGARAGDAVFVTGTLGDAGLALRQLLRGEHPDPGLRARLEHPEPRVDVGRRLLQVASAAIDISDGLATDLAHVLEASGVGAEVMLDSLPLSGPVAHSITQSGDWDLALGSGDDYELCFTVPPDRRAAVAVIAAEVGCGIRQVGRILTAAGGLVWVARDGARWHPRVSGYDHFARSAVDGP